MDYWILLPIKTDDNLARLFNAYANNLRTLEALAQPVQTMREYFGYYQAELVADDPEVELPAHYKRFLSTREYNYALRVLNNSLHDFHRNVRELQWELRAFQTEFQSDLAAYATKNDYSLYTALEQFFDNPTNRDGERIGASNGDDFGFFTSLVTHATDFSLTKILRARGVEPQTALVNEYGKLRPLTLGDSMEAELNQDLANGRIAGAFGGVWDLGVQLANAYRQMNPKDPASYHTLLKGAEQLLSVQFS